MSLFVVKRGFRLPHNRTELEQNMLFVERQLEQYLHVHESAGSGVGNFLDRTPDSLIAWDDQDGPAYGTDVVYDPTGSTQGQPEIVNSRVRVNSDATFSETFAIYLVGDNSLWPGVAPFDDIEWPASGFLPAGEVATFSWQYNTNAVDEDVFFFGPMDAQVDAYTTGGSSHDFESVALTTIPGTLPSSHSIVMGPYEIDTFLYAQLFLGFTFTGGDGWWCEVFDFELSYGDGASLSTRHVGFRFPRRDFNNESAKMENARYLQTQLELYLHEHVAAEEEEGGAHL